MGVIEKLTKKWLTEEGKSCETASNLSADLGDVASLFLVLTIGILLSFMVLLIEKFIKK